MMPTALSADATDHALLRRYQITKDDAVFAEIVRRYADTVYATCRRVLRDAGAAEDAAQETFFRFLQQPEAVEHSLGGWLHRTATRLSIDLVRSDQRRRAREHIYEQERAPAALKAQTWSEVVPHLDEALAELPGPQQWILVQHYLRQRSLRSLAEEIGSSPATLSRRLKEATQAMRVQLGRRGVVAAPSVIVCLLTSEPAPASLMVELNRMTLFSTSLAGGATTVGLSGWVKLTAAALLCIGVAMGAILLWSVVPPPGTQGLDGSTADVVPMPAATSTTPWSPASAARFITLTTDMTDLDGRRLVMFQDPATSPDDRLTVVFGDGRTVTLPRDEARRLVVEQEGVHAWPTTP